MRLFTLVSTRWSFKDTKFSQLAGLYLLVFLLISSVIWIYSYLCLFSRPVGIVPSALTITSITIAFIFHYCFGSLKTFRIFFPFSFTFALLNQKTLFVDKFFSFCELKDRSCLLAWVAWSIFISKYQRIYYYHYYYYYYDFTPCWVFTPMLSDGLSLKSQWQQISSNPYDSSL